MCRLIKRERERERERDCRPGQTASQTVELSKQRLANTGCAVQQKAKPGTPISWLSASVAPKCGQPSLASEGDLVQSDAVVVAAKLTIQNLKLLFTPKKAVKQHLDLLDKQHFDK